MAVIPYQTRDHLGLLAPLVAYTARVVVAYGTRGARNHGFDSILKDIVTYRTRYHWQTGLFLNMHRINRVRSYIH